MPFCLLSPSNAIPPLSALKRSKKGDGVSTREFVPCALFRPAATSYAYENNSKEHVSSSCSSNNDESIKKKHRSSSSSGSVKESSNQDEHDADDIAKVNAYSWMMTTGSKEANGTIKQVS